MIWISVSLLGLTGWQGYRLGREYGWWGRATVLATRKNKQEVLEPEVSHSTTSTVESLGRSKTNFDRLLTGYGPADIFRADAQNKRSSVITGDSSLDPDTDLPITEPATTLNGFADNELIDDYPDETDQVPAGCSWIDDESISLVDEATPEEKSETGGVPVTEYVKRVRTVQRKMNQLTQRRQADSSFVKHELGLLIQTYQLENDQSLDWLFQQKGELVDADYGSLFDRIERIAA